MNIRKSDRSVPSINHPNRIFVCLFPDEPRDFPYRRSVRIILRTLHILTAGILLGGHVFSQPASALELWLWLTVISGLILLATDVHASLALLIEVRGIAALTKILLLILASIFQEIIIPVLVFVIIISVVVSHMPKRYRHKVLLFPNHINPDQRSG